MTIQEYIAKAKDELDKMMDFYLSENVKNPVNYPLDMSEDEWCDQELAMRFGV